MSPHGINRPDINRMEALTQMQCWGSMNHPMSKPHKKITKDAHLKTNPWCPRGSAHVQVRDDSMLPCAVTQNIVRAQTFNVPVRILAMNKNHAQAKLGTSKTLLERFHIRGIAPRNKAMQAIGKPFTLAGAHRKCFHQGAGAVSRPLLWQRPGTDPTMLNVRHTDSQNRCTSPKGRKLCRQEKGRAILEVSPWRHAQQPSHTQAAS